MTGGMNLLQKTRNISPLAFQSEALVCWALLAISGSVRYGHILTAIQNDLFLFHRHCVVVNVRQLLLHSNTLDRWDKMPKSKLNLPQLFIYLPRAVGQLLVSTPATFKPSILMIIIL